MWFLKSLKDESICFGLTTGKQYTVGRKKTDILIVKDVSISRQHAVLQVSHPDINLDNPDKVPVLTLKDTNSKFGTFVNTDTKIGSIPELLKNGNIITFGYCGSSFRVCYKPLIATTSCLNGEEKTSLKKLILKIGGHLVSEWRTDCTHLVMNGIKVTTKAVCAMVSLKPIVKPEYFTQLLNRWEAQTDLPDSSMHIPPIDEKCLTLEEVSFNLQHDRKTVFKEKTFIFLTKSQYKKLHLMISLAGGKAVLLGDDQNITEEILLNTNTCVMAAQNNMASQDQESRIAQLLKRNKKRMIPEYEIGLAVVYCSTDKHCNPDYNIASTLFGDKNLISQTFSQQEVYAEQTQMSHFSCEEKISNMKHSVLPSSVEESAENKQIEPPYFDVQNWKIKTFQNPLVEAESSTKPAKRERGSSSGDIMPGAKHIKLESVPPVIQLDSEDPKLTKEFDVASNAIVKQEHASSDAETAQDMQLNNNFLLSSVISTHLSQNVKAHKVKTESLHNTENQNHDDDLPRNLMLTEFATLIIKKPLTLKHHITSKEPTIKNFKRFKKVQLDRGNFLPCIIGGRDLEVYSKSCSKAIDEWLNEHPDTETQENEADIFDWNIKHKKRKR